MPYIRVVATRGYDRRARKLFTAQERTAAEMEIALSPEAWPVIAGTGGCRKARARRGDRGKSGGVRMIYYYLSKRGLLFLWDIYAKSDKEDLTNAEKAELRKAVKEIESEA